MLSSCPAVHALLSDLVMLLFSALDLRDCCCFLVQQPFGICVLGMPPSHRCSFIIAQSQLYSPSVMAQYTWPLRAKRQKGWCTKGWRHQEVNARSCKPIFCVSESLFFTSISIYLYLHFFLFVHFCAFSPTSLSLSGSSSVLPSHHNASKIACVHACLWVCVYVMHCCFAPIFCTTKAA